MYKDWFYRRLTDPVFRDKVHSLKGKVLACWCKPDTCHGDIIVEYLEYVFKSNRPSDIEEGKLPRSVQSPFPNRSGDVETSHRSKADSGDVRSGC
jgi:hypothetical protein